VTTFAQVRLAQPLTGLVTLSQLLGAAQHDAAAARADYDRSRLAAAYATAEAFVRVLEARATADVAHQSVVDIAGSLDRAQKLRLADTLTNVDVLRLRSAKAAADQASVRADTTSEVAIAQSGWPSTCPTSARSRSTSTPPAPSRSSPPTRSGSR